MVISRTNLGLWSVFLAKRINDGRITSLKLRLENSGLVSYLTAAKEKSDKINEKLLLEIAERERIEKELRNSEGHLRYLSPELLNTQEKERRLVAQEIHDSIEASLAATKYKLQSVNAKVSGNRPQTREALESILPMLQETIEEARRIQMSLRPSILDDLGILVTMNWFCRQFESTYSKIHIRKEIDIQEQQVPDSLKTVIFRVLQEAMNNNAKYSKADLVRVSLRKLNGKMELVLQDNGRGFNLEKVISKESTNRGMGLTSMRERVELLGGSFAIESAEGEGTTIRASWSLGEIG